jgi:peptidyl-tRNA hydrolase, PTH1 family
MSEDPLLIAGLGNPGQSYARNRHNVGFMGIDVIHESYEFGPWRRRFEGIACEGTLARRKTWLLKPATYMNESGRSVGAAARFFKLEPESIVVMHDEIDLAAGKLRMKAGGGDAGHNGLRSITSVLGPAYRRVRIGVGHPGEKDRVHGHVLQNFSAADEEWLVPLLSAIAKAAPFLARGDDAGFMNKVAVTLNPPPKKPPPEKPEKKDQDGI